MQLPQTKINERRIRSPVLIRPQFELKSVETFIVGVLMICESKQGNQFLDPMTSFSRIECIPPNSEDLAPLIVFEPAILSALSKLNPLKATGPDGITSWILKEYADILPPSITTILNSSFVEQRCPSEDG